MQIMIYLNLNGILFAGQHGFRNGHSCETALHELISELNKNKNKTLISLLLFIDFRKAFDLVDSKKLLRKLFHYGFDKYVLDLISNYFTDRFQTIKYDTKRSPQSSQDCLSKNAPGCLFFDFLGGACFMRVFFVESVKM